MIGGVTIINSDVSNVALLAAAFQNLRSMTGNLLIQNNPSLVSLDGAFPQLQSVGGLQMERNVALTTIGSGFSSLRTVHNYLYWFGGQTDSEWNVGTVGSRAFCASAVARLCPTTTTWQNSGWADDTDNCCTAYCAMPSTTSC